MSGICDTCKIRPRCISPAGGVLECTLYEQNRKDRWFKLFGTPERAAVYFAMQCFGSDGSMCYYCPFDDCDERLRNSGTYLTVKDALLEWLRGDA